MPAIPGDAQDDKRDDEPDDGIRDLESEGDDRCRNQGTTAEKSAQVVTTSLRLVRLLSPFFSDLDKSQHVEP